MPNFSYTTTPELRYNLKAFDDLRRDIVLQPIPPKYELRAAWDTRIKQLTAILSITGYPFAKRDVVETLTSTKKPTDERAIVSRLHEAMSAIQRDWFASTKPLTISTVETIVGITFPKTNGLYARRLGSHETPIRQLLEYVDNDKEHSLLRGSIAYIEILRISPFNEDSRILASLLMHLVLVKNGHTARGLLAPQIAWTADSRAYEKITTDAINMANFTDWLNWATQTSVTLLEQARNALSATGAFREIPSSFFDLNDRQKVILTMLEEPERKIRNKDVVKRFKISQITASRDLTRMAQLELIYPRGKGRSVYYTKI